jgi:hypothetical protein
MGILMIYISVDVGDIGSNYRRQRQYSGGITSIPSFFEYESLLGRGREYMCVGVNVRKEGQHSLYLLSKYIHFLHSTKQIALFVMEKFNRGCTKDLLYRGIGGKVSNQILTKFGRSKLRSPYKRYLACEYYNDIYKTINPNGSHDCIWRS